MNSSVDEWNTVVAFPVVPFRRGAVDYEAHAKNIHYLVTKNWLDAGRRRVVGIAGTSLIHHLEPDEQVRLVEITSRIAGDRAVVVSGLVPNPPGLMAQLVARQSKLARPPEAYLIMPVNGVANPEGIYQTLLAFCNEQGSRYGAKFWLYLRHRNHREALARLTRDSDYVLGVKVGSDVSDVRPLVDVIGDKGAVMWGIGDCATDGIEQGARGHTSGIALLFARASDQINNAYRCGDFAASRRLEAEIAGFEHLRFMQDRAYNYSAVVAAARLAGFDDIDCGEGGPFNALPPPEVLEQIAQEVEKLRPYH